MPDGILIHDQATYKINRPEFAKSSKPPMFSKSLKRAAAFYL
jgi:hypothetical protein